MSGKRPTVISLFAGCGGSSLGYRSAGFRELLAIDFDKNCAKTFEFNFPGVPFWRADISKISGQEILKFCKIKKGELDVLDGSPPCQTFSRAGHKNKKRITDPRGQMGFQFSRLIKEIKPKVFLMENVGGMVEGKNRGIFKELFIDLKSRGYSVKARMVNSKYHGVPQSRDRLIFIGVRKDLKTEPSYPPRRTKPMTCLEAIGDVDISKEEIRFVKGKFVKYVPDIKEGKGLDSILGYTGFNLRRIHHRKPSNTITAMWSPGIAGLIHYNEDRFLTIKELKILASFPAGFRFTGDFRTKWKQIGNAVMPKFMESLARHIKNKILREIKYG